MHRLKVTSALSCESSGRSSRWPSSPARTTGTSLADRRPSESSQARSDGSIAATDVTPPGYQGTLSPLPKPISSTRPVSPAQTALRSSSSSGPRRLRSVRRGSTRSSHTRRLIA